MVKRIYPKLGLWLLLLAALSGCKPEGFINKTKYEGETVTNTCATFEEEVTALIEANQGSSILRVAEYDNSQFDYFYLEPGQIEIIGDTLYARLINDINYDKYLHKGVAVQVGMTYTAQEHLRDMEADPEGELGNPLIIDRAYFDANRDPFFVYKLPVGNRVDGKQISLVFSIVQYKKGQLKKVFCNSVEVPLGPVDPSCCTSTAWQEVRPQSVVQVPELEINPEQYRYQGFTGTLDLIFPMSSVKFNVEELTDVLLNYISKYNREGFQVEGVSLTGYASQGGKQESNQALSESRAAAVYGSLKKYFEEQGRADQVNLTHRGLGEDWERFEILVKTAVFTDQEREQLLGIAHSNMTNDEKEAELRRLPFWNKLVQEVLVYNRHVMVEFNFKYQPDRMYVEMYPSQMPVIAPELYNVATKKMTVTRFTEGDNPNEGLRVLNTLIDVNTNKTANLYAMRSTYHFALNNVRSAISDIENAMNVDRENPVYGLAALSYKTKLADTYSLSERMKMLSEYNTLMNRFPNNRMLQINRVVMMDKVGFISGALAEYQNLVTESSQTAALLNNRGVARLKGNRVSEAEADFTDAIRMDANIAEPYFNLAVVNAYKGRPEQALNNLERALKLAPALKEGIARNPAFSVLKSNPRFQQVIVQ